MGLSYDASNVPLYYSLSVSLPLHHNFSVDLVDQVRQWALYASDVVPHPPEETLTAFWIGINDTGDTLQNTTVRPFDVRLAGYEFNALLRLSARLQSFLAARDAVSVRCCGMYRPLILRRMT